MMRKAYSRGCRIICIVLCLVMIIAGGIPVSAEEKGCIISDELLEMMNVKWEEFEKGDFESTGEAFPCVLWIQDIDMEEAVIYGIDAAEQTRQEPKENYTYPYEVYYDEETLNKDLFVDIPIEEDDLYVQTYVEAKRAKARELYEENNLSFIDDTLQEFKDCVEYVSHYSPCIFVNLKADEIYELFWRGDINYIGAGNTAELEDSSQGLSSGEENDLNTWKNIIRATSAQNTYDVSGAGVKIGQMEEYCSRYIDSDKIDPVHNVVGSVHANKVLRIMRSVAPSATYYASALNRTDGGMDQTLAYGVEWLLDQGVNIINFSAGFQRQYNTYDDMARWTDHIAYNHDAHFVMAAGNEGAEAKVRQPGMAYNIITVGAIDMYQSNNQNTPYYRLTDSSYNGLGANRSEKRTFKPDVMAPGRFGSSGDAGTSYATPLVTGAIALMCQYRPALKTKQHIVKAILGATTSKTAGRYTTNNSNVFKEYGAGVIDVHAALYAVSTYHYSTSTGSLKNAGEYKTYSIEVTSSDTTMRIALAYANRIKFTNTNAFGNHAGLTAPASGSLIGELRLEVRGPSGDVVTKCEKSGANYKIVQFNPGDWDGPGTYTVKVYVYAAAGGGRTTNFGISWR